MYVLRYIEDYRIDYQMGDSDIIVSVIKQPLHLFYLTIHPVIP